MNVKTELKNFIDHYGLEATKEALEEIEQEEEEVEE